MKYEILIETEDYIAVNKPAGLLSIPDRHDDSEPSLFSLLKQRYENILVVHRIDKPTSGIILFAKTPEVHKYFSQLFENRKIRKSYTGIVHGRVQETSGTIDAPIAESPYRKGEMMVSQKGKPAITHFTTLETNFLFSVLNFDLETGRTHQIRVHAKHINHPLLCDPIYGDGKPVFLSDFKKDYNKGKKEEEERPLLNRLALHATSLNFKDPNGKDVHIEAPLPKDMKALMNQMRKHIR
ncbi:MAG: RluA family pseudouridine synthase [Chitinophagaceae bacterium]|nr:RluA family pseudouridine synthase [Chitinophagaceae bacterium]